MNPNLVAACYSVQLILPVTSGQAAIATRSLGLSPSFSFSGAAASACVGSSTGTSGRATRSSSGATGTFGYPSAFVLGDDRCSSPLLPSAMLPILLVPPLPLLGSCEIVMSRRFPTNQHRI
jgi:hypothetical protein